MIWFNFQISNPFWKFKNQKPQKDYLSYEKMITKHKFVEFQISKWSPNTLFKISIDTCWFGQDHAGFEINMEIYGFYFAAMLRDNRHWNYKEDRFMTDEEAMAEYEEWKKENGNE